MKSGSIAAHEAARNIEDATDGAEEPKRRRNAGPLTLGKAVDLLVDMVASERAAIASATEEIRVRFGAKREAIFARVPQELHDAVAGAVSAALDAQVERWPVRQVIDGEFRDPGVDDDEPSAGDVAEANETPSRPTLEEYDVGVALEATAVPRGAQPYVPGPAAQAAMKGRR